MKAPERPGRKGTSGRRRQSGEGRAAADLAGTALEERRGMPIAAPEAEEPELVGRHVGVAGRAWLNLRRTVGEAAQWHRLAKTPYGVGPALLLGVAAIVKGFDGAIFGLVLPDIVQDLDLNVVNLLQVINVLGFVFIVAALALSYLMDRVRRVPFVAGGTIIGGIASLLTPQAGSNYTLGATRVGDAVGDTAATIPEFSLVADYYPVEMRGKAFAFVGTLRRIGFSLAPWLIALLVVQTEWRVPFRITGGLLVVLGVVMFLVLREPVRGFMERRAAGASTAEAEVAEPPPSFGQAWRTVWGIRTLRRLFVGSVAGGVGDRTYAFVITFFLFQDYGMDVIDRGKLFSVAGLAAALGGFLGGGIVDSLMARRPQRVLIFSGSLSVVAALAIGGLAATPPRWVVWILFAAFGFTFALLGPARRVFFAQILPAHIRTLGLNVAVLADIPAVIIFGVLLNQIPSWGFSGVLFASAPFFLVGAIIDISAAGFFTRDARSAVATQTATAEYLRAKKEGTVKLLVCRDVDVEYDGVQVLFGVDFEADEAEIIALLGTNGAGKSTLLKAISGVHEATGGAVLFDGRDVTHVPPYEVTQRGIVHMPGGRGIFPGLSVRENLVLGTWTHGERGPAEMNPLSDMDMDEVLEIFPMLKGRLDSPAGALSGGEQQMVSLAQAFLQRPRLLLIDELSLGLSPAIVQQLLESVREINRRGVTIVVVEQSVNIALTLAERAVFMEKGEVKFVGPTRELLARPDILRAVYVKGTGALTGQPGSRKAPRRRAEDRRVVLSVEGLTKSFGGVMAVDDVSFELHDEEILGLIGPNGAGKTTIFDLISGYVKADAGRVRFEGTDVSSMGPDERARLQLVRRFQDARLFPSLTVYETILVALERRQSVRNMALIALQLPQARQSERRARSRADQLVELLGLGAYRDKFVKELSTGLRRVTDLACVLATEPRVLLLDEPSSGIAQAEAEFLGPLLRRVRRETGCSILVIEHDMPLISRVAAELLALDQGRVVMRDVPDVVLNDPRVIESYLGTSEAAIRRSGR